jgi:hypothetical protein
MKFLLEDVLCAEPGSSFDGAHNADRQMKTSIDNRHTVLSRDISLRHAPLNLKRDKQRRFGFSISIDTPKGDFK